MAGRGWCRPRRRAHRPALTTTVTALLGVVVLLTTACRAPATAAGSTGTTGKREPSFKVTVAGDSISIGLGASLRTAAGDDVVVKVIGIEGTGLARPDRFDWPARLVQLAREYPPQILVLSLSSNDAQDLTDLNGTVVARFADKAAWETEYARRLAASFDAFAQRNTTVVWVGHVRTAEDKVGLTNRRIQRIATTVAASRPFVVVKDLAALLATGEARADRCLNPDGLHLTVPCLDEAATALTAQLQDRLPKR